MAWIKKYRHQYLIKAIDDPTPKNVRAFMYVNNAMYDKAQDFANMFFYQAHFDTALNPTMTAPTTQAGLDAFYAKETAGKKSTLQYLAKNTGIFFFFSDHCPYCKLQNIQLHNFLCRWTCPPFLKVVASVRVFTADWTLGSWPGLR